jgi:hypothetical protein
MGDNMKERNIARKLLGWELFNKADVDRYGEPLVDLDQSLEELAPQCSASPVEAPHAQRYNVGD